MTTLEVTVVATQRLALGAGAEVSYFTDGHPFVPGSALRGALAAAWIAEYGPPTGAHGDRERFRALFDGEIRYGPLLPVDSARVPLSVYRCKYPTSFRCRAVAVDQAFADGEAFGGPNDCPSCGRRLEQSKGDLLRPPGTGMETAIRTSIDESTGQAKDGALYARAALPARTVLRGTIFGRDPWLEQPRTLRLGGRRTVGGGATYQATPAPPGPVCAGRSALVIRLISPAIFVDLAGRPQLDPHPDLDLGGARVHERWTRPVASTGWHVASRLPKPTEISAEAGSTYRVTGAAETLAALAHRVHQRGLGLRRTEGFGVAEIATQPWQVPTHVERPVGPTQDRSGDRLRELLALHLSPPERRWLLGALRGLQIDLQRPIEDSTRITLIDALLAQPTPAGLSGRQRESLRQTLRDLGDAELRDLTTMLAASEDR